MPKILSLKIIEPDVSEEYANEIFDQVSKFSGYGFNKSHSVAYALISYLCMWAKVHYPAAFFAGVLTMVKEDRNPAILAEMRRMGITLRTPDVDLSTGEFEVGNESMLIMPFTAIKGISDNTATAIMAARDTQPGKCFADLAVFEASIEKRRCNSKHRSLLDLVGAFSRIVPGSPAHDDPCRKMDQVTLLRGLMEGGVIADPMRSDDSALGKLVDVINGWRSCELCSLTKSCHPRPGLTARPKLMLVLDGPNWKEEAADEMGHGNHMDSIETAMLAAGLSLDDAYITSMVKAPKIDKKTGYTNETIGQCAKWVDQEIEALAPPVVVLLGTLAGRHFLPDVRFGESAARIVWDGARKTNFVVGINPNAIYFSPEKQTLLNDAFSEAAALLPVY